MNSLQMRRGHRKRNSALRLSTDSTLSALPVYTSPSAGWQRSLVVVQDDPTDLPPEYPDSAEEADEDTDTEGEEESAVLYGAPTSSTPLTSPLRRPRRLLQGGSRIKPRRSASTDPYLDSLLARSVHALEMSNALLQSSMSTQATLNNVLASGSQDETALETHARNLSSRINGDSNWTADLDIISKGVEGLFEENEGDPSRLSLSEDTPATSRSLPASSSLSAVGDRLARTHRRRPSLDLRNASLSLSEHGRSDLVAPPPRAITMYVDSSDDPSSISLPATLGLRPSSRQQPITPLPTDHSFITRRPLLLHAIGSESDVPKRAIDILSSVANPTSNSTSSTASPCSSFRNRRGSSSTSTSTATRKPRRSSSPHSHPSTSSRSPSKESNCRSPSSSRRAWDTPPIMELPSASSSESSDDLHVDRTVSYLRNILEHTPLSPSALEKQKQKEDSKPMFLKPPSVAPIADTSNATASVSRLFTKARHTTSTRPPSPPRHSALKGKSGRSVPPTPTSPALSLSSSWQSVSDAIGIGGGSGRTTPNRVSFIEPPDAAKGSKDKSSLRTRSRSRTKGKGKSGDGELSDTPTGWWTWLIGPAPAAGGTNVPPYVRQEERLVRGGGWAPRAGFGGSTEEWGV
jgi:hypothetical protein